MTIGQIPSQELEILLDFFPDGLVALDLETTGLSPLVDKIIEVAVVKVSPEGKLSTFESLVNPEREIPAETIKIHNISNDMVASSPKIHHILPQVMNFIGEASIVAHNASFDLGFMLFALNELELDIPPLKIFDSCRLARYTLRGSPNFRLTTLSEYLSLNRTAHHRALDDTWACLRVFTHSLLQIEKSGRFGLLKDKGFLYDLKNFKRERCFEVPSHLKEMVPLVRAQEVLEIEYRGGSHREKFRPVRAVGLMPLPHGSVLYAHCLLSGLFKSFHLRKIQSFRPLSAQDQAKWREVMEKQKQKNSPQTTPEPTPETNEEE